MKQMPHAPTYGMIAPSHRWASIVLLGLFLSGLALGGRRPAAAPQRNTPFHHSLLPSRLSYLESPSLTVTPGRSSAPAPSTAAQASPASVPLPMQPSVTGTDSVKTAWVRRFASGRVPSSDYPDALAADSSGNIYVAGVSEGRTSDGDGLTLKYSPSGVPIWQARYTNANDAYTELRAIAVDTGKNVYVTGFTTDDRGRADFLTIKYDSSGTELWHRIYRGGADSDDAAVAVVVDKAGNCTVLGTSDELGDGYDMTLISYTPAGDLRWIQLIDGGNHGDDRAAALALEPDGSTVLTGTTVVDTSTKAILTMRCRPNGSIIWRSLYQPSGSASAVSLVCGDSSEVSVVALTEPASNVVSFTVIHYAPDGTLLWAAPYNGTVTGGKKPAGIARDKHGDLYVAAAVQRVSIDYLTVKFDHSSGSIVWENVYDNSYHGDDYPTGVTVTSEEYITVTGFSRYTIAVPFDFLTIQFDTSGKAPVVSRYNQGGNDVLATGIVADNSGDVFVAGAVALNSFDIQIVKYSSHETGAWSVAGDLGSPADVASAVAADSQGNAYVSISDTNGIYVAKYDITSRLVWSAPLNGLLQGSGTAMCIDAAGYPFVTGYSRNQAGDEDIFTARLSPDGQVLWLERYNGPDSNDDYGVGIALDNAGNCVVTGSSYSPATHNDIVTIKYSSAGELLWISRYNFPFNSDESPAGLAIDHGGNVYVTGSSIHPSSSYDIATLKYNANGNLQWVRFYDGLGSGADFGKAIAIDSTDSVYVAGKSYGAATGTDAVLLKYSPTGVLTWIARYTGGSGEDEEATALAVDHYGNPVVAGIAFHASSSFDYLTLKYDPRGNLQWKHEYDGPAHGNDYAIATQIDRYNGIIVTGTSLGLGSGEDIVTIRYTEEGGQDWIQRFNGSANLDDDAYSLAVDPSGDVFVAGSSHSDVSGIDYLLLKYSAPRVQYWPILYDGPGISGDAARAIVVDHRGYVYVAGQSEQFGATTSLLTLQYLDDGTAGWSVLYPPNGNVFDFARDIVVDSAGSPVIMGLHQSGANATEYAMIKYGSGGGAQWMAAYAGELNSYNFPAAMTLDRSQSLVVTGYGLGSGTSYDYATIKYAGDGTPIWTARYNDPANDNDLATAVVVDSVDNVFVTGLTGTGGYPTNMTTVKYDATGSMEWAAVYDGPDHLDEKANAIALDSSGHIYVAGWSSGASSEHDFVTVKYDFEGSVVWAQRYNGPANNRDEATSIAVDRAGNIYVSGISYDVTFTNPDVVLLKYHSDGSLGWVRRFDGAGHSDDVPGKMALDQKGNIYLTVTTTDSTLRKELFTVSYDSAGTIRWIAPYREAGIASVEAADLFVDRAGTVYVAATSSGLAWKAITTIKYIQSGTDAVTERSSHPRLYSLAQNYPNPFNPETKISFSTARFGEVTLKVYDVLGREVVTLLHGKKESGTYSVSWDAGSLPSGVYFYRLAAGDFVQTKKMLLLR